MLVEIFLQWVAADTESPGESLGVWNVALAIVFVLVRRPAYIHAGRVVDGRLLLKGVQRLPAAHQLHGQLGPSGNQR